MELQNIFEVNIETTPNPDTLKFKLNQPLLGASSSPSHSVQFSSAQEAFTSPLAMKLFGFPWMSQVFIGEDFISIKKMDWVEWEYIAKPLSQLIENHLNSGEKIFEDSASLQQMHGTSEILPSDSEIVKNIKTTLNTEIRPAVAMDGGDIVFKKYEDQKLYLELKGACSGCPSSTMTLKEGIEVRMKELYPEIQEVVSH